MRSTEVRRQPPVKQHQGVRLGGCKYAGVFQGERGVQCCAALRVTSCCTTSRSSIVRMHISMYSHAAGGLACTSTYHLHCIALARLTQLPPTPTPLACPIDHVQADSKLLVIASSCEATSSSIRPAHAGHRRAPLAGPAPGEAAAQLPAAPCPAAASPAGAGQL